MNLDDAIRQLRADPAHSQVIEDSYLGEDVRRAAEGFARSAEFGAVRQLLRPWLNGATVVDVGAGRGIAAYAFARSEAAAVYAIEPDASEVVGRRAAIRATDGLPVQLLDATGEVLPLEDCTVDVVYVRQVLHHVHDLRKFLSECRRVMKPGGVLLATREHVVDNDVQLQQFLESHPVHRLAGGENAYSLEQYIQGIRSAGLTIHRILGPWDTVINAFPSVRSEEELDQLPRTLLQARWGACGNFLSMLPGVRSAVWWHLNRQRHPGRLYSFLAVKSALETAESVDSVAVSPRR